MHTLDRLAVELLLRGAPQPIGRVENTAASTGDLFVAQAVNLIQKLLLAAACIDEVRMRVAERGKERATLGIEHLVGLNRG